MESKYLGKVYEGFKVLYLFKHNSYKKKYKNDKKAVPHNAYHYILYNEKTNFTLIISGNQLRLVNNGIRTIDAMLFSRKGGYKNKEIGCFKKEFVL